MSVEATNQSQGCLQLAYNKLHVLNYNCGIGSLYQSMFLFSNKYTCLQADLVYLKKTDGEPCACVWSSGVTTYASMSSWSPSPITIVPVVATAGIQSSSESIAPAPTAAPESATALEPD